jgi:hypothetical protein
MTTTEYGMTSAQTAARLHEAIGEALQLFQGVDETRTTRPPAGGGWCARQVIGHLIDSACNNHRRFVLGQSAETQRYDGYNQDDWVDRQHYEKVPWRDLVTLWTAYNRHLAHVISCVPDAAAARQALGPDGSDPVTLTFLMDDYVTHLQHHVEQIRRLLTA